MKEVPPPRRVKKGDLVTSTVSSMDVTSHSVTVDIFYKGGWNQNPDGSGGCRHLLYNDRAQVTQGPSTGQGSQNILWFLYRNKNPQFILWLG